MYLLVNCAVAQTPDAPVPTAQPYGKIDIADLEMKVCDFEKDANDEILFNKADLYFNVMETNVTITQERHKRIKIFSDNGKSQADIKIPYYSGGHLENIAGLQAETINLVNGKPEVTKLDKKLIYTYNVAEYSRNYYANLHDFFKKMTEMLNEQIVLKKG